MRSRDVDTVCLRTELKYVLELELGTLKSRHGRSDLKFIIGRVGSIETREFKCVYS